MWGGVEIARDQLLSQPAVKTMRCVFCVSTDFSNVMTEILAMSGLRLQKKEELIRIVIYKMRSA